MNDERLAIRVHGSPEWPTLVYLPGTHGDWTLVSSFRAAVAGRVRFVEFNYPRTETWTLGDYATHIRRALADNGIEHGWLLAESFGSQVAWAMVEQGFRTDGLILAGGFVRHPLGLEVEFGHWFCSVAPRWFLQGFLNLYRSYAKLRHRQAPETLASIDEFTERRKAPGERRAIVHRLRLIIESDLTAVSHASPFPVFHLAGFWDPIVPWWPVQAWLKRECPGFRGSHVVWNADHNVLATQPGKSAGLVLRWMAPGAKAREHN